MIVADSSTWIAFFENDSGRDVEMLRQSLQERQVVMAPVVLAELFSDPNLVKDVEETLLGIPLIETRPGFWHRVGLLRAKVLAKKRRARLGDSLLAQSCIDEGISLVTRDRDFESFAEAAGLTLVTRLSRN
jgi:predicted nucleic acid-binding protein